MVRSGQLCLIMAVNTAFVASQRIEMERVSPPLRLPRDPRTNRRQSLYRIHYRHAIFFSIII